MKTYAKIFLLGLAFALTGCSQEQTTMGPGGEDRQKIYAIVTKSAGNPYNEAIAAGFQDIIEQAGQQCVVLHPDKPTAEAQADIVQKLITEKVDAICIAGNDENALENVLGKAMDAGISVSCLDARVNADSRQLFINQAGRQEIGRALLDAVLDLAEGEGQWAILSATSQASNQNAWIDAMKDFMMESQYGNLSLVDVVYGDDEFDKSAQKTRELLEKYPKLKVICAPTVVGIEAAADVLKEKGSSVLLTGLGLPSTMEAYVGDGTEYPCPYMYLWNPMDVGKLGAYASLALAEGTITGAEGDTFTAGDMKNSPYTIIGAEDGGTEVVLGAPYRFDASNIREWANLY